MAHRLDSLLDGGAAPTVHATMAEARSGRTRGHGPRWHVGSGWGPWSTERASLAFELRARSRARPRGPGRVAARDAHSKRPAPSRPGCPRLLRRADDIHRACRSGESGRRGVAHSGCEAGGPGGVDTAELPAARGCLCLLYTSP